MEQVKKNRLTIDHFEIKHIIGQGHFGEVSDTAAKMKHQRCGCLGGTPPFHIHSKLQLLYLPVQQSQCSIIVMQSA